MSSPFPGMDPYLERYWLDVHPRLCTYACDALNSQLGRGLLARLGERLVVESVLERPRNILPDVRIVERPATSQRPARPAAGAALAEPMIITIESDPIRQAFIEIVDLDAGRLVTLIEFVSPTNRDSGSGRRDYRRKQEEVFQAQLSLMEVDLIRAGEPVILAARHGLPDDAIAPFMVSVFRGIRPRQLEYFPIRLPDPLPRIGVPLRPGDSDAALDLAALLDQVYAQGRYAEVIDYTLPCVPPLRGDEAAWADALLRSAQVR